MMRFFPVRAHEDWIQGQWIPSAAEAPVCKVCNCCALREGGECSGAYEGICHAEIELEGEEK